MDYTFLAKWVCEFTQLPRQIEKLELNGNAPLVYFKDRDLMLFVDDPSGGFVYLDAKHRGEGETKPLWSQLVHADLYQVDIMDNDRIVSFSLRSKDIYGETNEYRLIAEFSPKHFNLILCQSEGSRLIIRDALKKYSYADNPQRQVLPSLEYQAPMTSYRPESKKLSYPLEIKSLRDGATHSCKSMNAYLRSYHHEVILARRELAEKQRLQAFWKRELAKLARKHHQQEGDLESAQKADLYFSYAEAIKYQMHSILPGQESLKAINYHDPELGEIVVPLQADKSPLQNMNLYMKKYQKAKKGLAIIQDNLLKTAGEMQAMQDILDRVAAGELVHPPGAAKDAKLSEKLKQAAKLLSLRLNSDFEIVIGRKARENDFITTQLARPTDWWFHTRVYHGSHILLRCLTKKDPDHQLIQYCSSLAAWYSKAKFSSNVPVDYTQIRFVRKPRKSAPGYVIYSNQHTLYVEPMDLRALKEKLGL